MTTTSPLALYKHQTARFKAVEQTARQMHAEIVRESHQDAVKLTSGGIGPQGRGRLPWLAKNRPFARNITRSRLRVKPLPIGMISMDIVQGWKVVRVSSPKGQEFHLRNSAKHAKYILFDAGTTKMRGRGFQAETRKRFRARNKALIDTIRTRQSK